MVLAGKVRHWKLFALLLDLSREKVLGSAKWTQALSASVSSFPIASGRGFNIQCWRTATIGLRRLSKRAKSKRERQPHGAKPSRATWSSSPRRAQGEQHQCWRQLCGTEPSWVEQQQCQRQLCRFGPAKRSGLRWQCGTTWMIELVLVLCCFQTGLGENTKQQKLSSTYCLCVPNTTWPRCRNSDYIAFVCRPHQALSSGSVAVFFKVVNALFCG